ncbi:MAG: hypothetical protein GC159_14840 [Phycisphaera sp.]|nr:hypothetical protein [Phycisphaera sp.]
MKITLTLIVAAIAVLGTPLRGADGRDAARAYLEAHRVCTQPLAPPADYAALRAKVAASRDPQTKIGPYFFALAGPRSKVLSPEQHDQLNALIEAKKAEPVDWHDVRNIVRVESLMTLWDYAAETDPAKLAELDKRWNDWNELRLAYMFEEFVARDRFQRAAWAVLTAEQKQQLAAGDFDASIKKNTGHSRAFSADKQVLRALGQPRDQAAFDKAAAAWRAKWEAVADANEAAAKLDRQRELAMDLTDEAFAAATAHEAGKAFGAFARAERDAIRDLLHAGYAESPDVSAAVAKAKDDLRTRMLDAYGDHGAELLRMMGETK